MAGPYAIRVKQPDGTWQDIAIGGAQGPGIPTGGEAGEVLAKKSATDLDTEWVEQTGGTGGGGGVSLPDGGTTGQHLAKASANDGDADWVDVEYIRASAFHGDGAATAIALSAAVWKTLPVTRAFAQEPASGDFAINGDGSVTVVKAGWYSLSATAFYGGGASGAIYLTIGNLPNAEGSLAEADATSTGALTSTSISAVYLTANYKVYVVGYSGTAASGVVLRQFSIARVGGPQGAKGDTGGSATVPIEAWRQVGTAPEPVFQNGWIAYDSGVYFRKDPLGRVWLRGSVNGGATGTVAFTLPVGYRPVLAGLTRVRAIALQNQQATGQWECQVSVHTDGNVYVYSTAPTATIYASLDQISFDSGTVTEMPTGPKGDTGGTMGAVNYRSDQGPVNLNVTNWVTMDPRSTKVMEPLGSIIENADKSISVLEEGWYDFSVQVCSVTTGGSPIQFDGGVHVALATTPTGYDVATAESRGSPSTAAQASLSTTIKMTTATKIFITAYASSTMNLVIRNLTIARSGGPVGPKGKQGDPGIYESFAYGNGPATSVAHGTFVLLPVATGITISSSDGTNPDFTRNADGTITVRKAGLYQINAYIGQGPCVGKDEQLEGRILVTNDGSVPTAGNWLMLEDDFSTGVGQYLSVSFGGAWRFPNDGGRIGFMGYATTTGGVPKNVNIASFSIARVGAGPKGDIGPAGPTGTVPIEAWHTVGAAGEPAFTGTWRAYNASYPPQFRKRPDGIVEMRGLLGGGTIATPAFTLPAGYLPPSTPSEVYIEGFGSATGAAGTVGPFGLYITSTGVVMPHNMVGWTPATGYLSVDQVRFSTDQATFPTGPKGDKGETGATGGNATVTMDTWHLVGAAGEPAYAASCSGGLRFRKDPLGRVWLFGTASSPTTPTTVFTLPVGYRPAIDFIYDNLQSAGLAGTYVQINTAGAVTITWPQGSGYVDLSFDTGLVTAMPTGPTGPQGLKGESGNAPVSEAYLNAIRSADQAITTGVETHVIYTSAPTTRGTLPPTIVAGGGVRIEESGTYAITAYGYFNDKADSNRRVLQLYVGGNRVARSSPTNNGSNNNNPGDTLSATLYIAAGTTVSETIYHDCGTGMVWQAAAMTVAKVGPGAVGPQGPVGGNATLPIEAWRTVGAVGQPAFGSGCSASGTDPPQFMKDPAGVVWLRGVVNTPTTGNPILFTLPAGYIPSIAHQRWFPWPNAGFVSIDNQGIVQAFTPSSGTIDLSDIHFRVDQATFPTGPQGPPGPGVRGLVTSLPIYPQDGDECYFQNAAMATNGIIWHFRYRTASTSAYKWEYMGGSVWQTDTGLANIPLGNNTGIGPYTLTLPLGGDYMVEHGGRFYNSGSPPYGNMSSRLQTLRAAAVVQTDIAIVDFWTVASTGLPSVSITPHLMKTARLNAVVAGDIMRQVGGATGSSGVIDHAFMSAVPVRVG